MLLPGRVSLVDLAEILNVDLSHITQKAAQLQSKSRNITVVLGQLINGTYITQLAEEINDLLVQRGFVSTNSLTQQYDLPNEFLQKVVQENLGKIIRAKQDPRDPNVFFTEAFVARNMATIRGAIIGIMKPTAVSTLLNLCGVQDRLFYSLFEELAKAKQVPGTLSGKQVSNSMYVPSVYSKSQSDWVDQFYRQNGFLEYDAMSRVGISDGQAYVKKHLAGENLLFLDSAAIGPSVLEQIKGAIEEAVSTGTWVDILPTLPSALDTTCAEQILVEVLKTVKTPGGSVPSVKVFNSTVVVTESFLNKLVVPLKDIVQQKAEKCVSSGAFQQWQIDRNQTPEDNKKDDIKEDKVDKRDERRKKAAGGKVGGGTQGRETKTKSTKKKGGRGGRGGGDSDDEAPVISSRKPTNLEIITIHDIISVISKEESFRGLDEDDKVSLLEEIAKHLHLSVNKTALDVAQAVLDSTMSNQVGTRRKTHHDLQEKLNNLITNIRLFERGLKGFSTDVVPPAKESAHDQLSKYLLKTFGTDIANEIVGFIAQERMLQWDSRKEMLQETRQKVAQESGGSEKEAIQKLNKSLTGSSLDDFFTALDYALGPEVCDVVVRKPDKKKERVMVFGHRQALLEQMNTSQEPAQVLHIAALILCQGVTQNMLHASGRYVNILLAFLQPHLPVPTFKTLQEYYDLVLKLLSTDDSDESAKETVTFQLQEKMSVIKEIANSFKKVGENKE
ncbi:E3 UFM1-protein ligase 1 homolog isoform X2 [Thrips palmi]|uniref:E3 UFM1-protein ligase 1 homolog n=1 Tax=Thrips palmi TaxID=161013 RepID=A0A6P9A660_THRPL|nr:E3 UFM1-protein ligase 1 homolog isoform X2 [Thrips palmi]